MKIDIIITKFFFIITPLLFYIIKTPTKIFSRSLVIAGNLDQRKSPYIKYLSEIKKIGVKLYGPNYSEEFNNANNI